MLSKGNFEGESLTNQILNFRNKIPDFDDFITHDIPTYNSVTHPFVTIGQNEFEDEEVKGELVQEYEKRMTNLRHLKQQGNRKWTCECDNGKGRDGWGCRDKLICFDMTCRNMASNLSCPSNCGHKSGAKCWNQNFFDPLVKFPSPPGLVLFETKFTGIGVMTTEKIEKGSITGEFIGIVGRGCTGKEGDIYSAQIAELPYHINPTNKGNYTRFLNHCGVRPNHDALCFFTPAGPRVLMVATKDILPGEECTWYYGGYWNSTFKEMGDGRCLCKNCVQIYSGE